MKRAIVLVMTMILLEGMIFGYAMADDDQIKIPAAIIKKFYNNDSQGLKGFLISEEARCLATICAYLDWYSYDSKADFLMDYSYIGMDKDGNILWIGLGGKNSSLVLAYAPDTDPNNYSGIKVDFAGSWIPSFIDLYCDPLYHNSGTTMKTTVEQLKNLIK